MTENASKMRCHAGPWYHGTPAVFEAFDSVHLGKGTDQLGSGFYFTSEETTAFGYAGSDGTILVADISFSKPMPADAKFTRRQIEAMLRASPFFEDGIANWGEIGFEKEETVVGRAVDSYASLNAGCDDAVQVLNAISNDMWGGREADFLHAVREATGYDGLTRASGNETHAVVWFPEQVAVLERRAAAVAVPSA